MIDVMCCGAVKVAADEIGFLFQSSLFPITNCDMLPVLSDSYYVSLY